MKKVTLWACLVFIITMTALQVAGVGLSDDTFTSVVACIRLILVLTARSR